MDLDPSAVARWTLGGDYASTAGWKVAGQYHPSANPGETRTSGRVLMVVSKLRDKIGAHPQSEPTS